MFFFSKFFFFLFSVFCFFHPFKSCVANSHFEISFCFLAKIKRKWLRREARRSRSTRSRKKTGMKSKRRLCLKTATLASVSSTARKAPVRCCNSIVVNCFVLFLWFECVQIDCLVIEKTLFFYIFFLVTMFFFCMFFSFFRFVHQKSNVIVCWKCWIICECWLNWNFCFVEIAADGLKGRIFEACLADLQRDEDQGLFYPFCLFKNCDSILFVLFVIYLNMILLNCFCCCWGRFFFWINFFLLFNQYSLAHRKIKLKCADVAGKNLLTTFYGMDLTTDKLRSLVRKWQSLIEAHVDVKTSDGVSWLVLLFIYLLPYYYCYYYCCYQVCHTLLTFIVCFW